MTVEEINAWTNLIAVAITPLVVALFGGLQTLIAWRSRVAADKAAKQQASQSAGIAKHLAEKTDEQTALILDKTGEQTTFLANKANVIHGLVDENMNHVLKAN